MLIGITGLAGSGKSEVARVLMDEFGFTRVKFADPLKNMARSLIRDVGHTTEDVERYVEGDLKESEIDGLGITARWLMQSLGTEWGRSTIRDSFWTDLFRERVDALGEGARVLCDDARFPNEFGLIRRMRGTLIRVERPGVEARAHPSEQFIAGATVHRVFANNSTLDKLRSDARRLARDLCA